MYVFELMKFQDFDTLEEMHIEITNRCNAACPMCARNNFGGKDKEDLVYGEWTVGDADLVFSDKFTKLRNILFCGTHGDPAVAKDCLGIVAAVKRKTKATIEFYSNGGVRNKEWWSQLGSLLSKQRTEKDNYYRQNDLGVFSIDGLADTNHIYRRRTNFDKIIENAEAFIKAGGHARWDYLVFAHNEHQVEEAQVLAKKLGFKNFRIRKTSRFAYSPDGLQQYPVLGNTGELEYYLKPPTQEKYLNEIRKDFAEVVERDRKNEMDLTPKIVCLKKTQFQRIYINAGMNVLPCCFISSDIYNTSIKAHKELQEKVFSKYTPKFNSLRQHSWEEILNHPWFARDLVKSWEDPAEKLSRCQRTCGMKVSPITSQSQCSQL